MEPTTITKLAHLQIPLEDVAKATNNFHPDNIIGRGGLGQAYKGQLQLRPEDELINITALRLDGKQGDRDLEFWTEISMLSDLNHTNIVSIVGFCNEKGEKIIVTTHVAKGSLQKHLNNPNLTWTQRLQISVDVARALSYLHHDERRGYGVIHLNINSSTVLLDDNWEPKLSGFKVSIKQLLNRMDQVVLSEPIGTIGHMDPQIVKTKGVSHKSDIYSFGVVLFEILCGRKAFIRTDEASRRLLAPLAKHHYENKSLKDIINPNLWNQMSPRSLEEYSKIAYSCLKERAHRPDLDYILSNLESALLFQLIREDFEKNLDHLKIHLSDIKSATNNFSETYKIEVLGHGYSLYRAKLDHFDTETCSHEAGKNKGKHPKKHNTVIIKRYPFRHDFYGEEEFLTEIEMLTSVKHPNIVTLLGFCFEDSEMILVIENVSNGFLAHHIRNHMCTFTWKTCLKICIDVAQALNYLHFEMEDQKTIINRDINSYSIGLDENWGAKIFEFRNSVFLPPNQEDETLYLSWLGFPSYIDPEYKMYNMLKRESDVYGFGVVLFEILCGRLASDTIYLNESKDGLAPLARQSVRKGTIEEMINPIIKKEISEKNSVLNRGPNTDSLHTFIEIAYKCVAETQDQRPTIKVVVKELEKALYFQENNSDNYRMSLEDIKLATENFHDINCIGGGGSRGKVYKGKVPQGDRLNTIVAKRLNTRLGQGERRFLNELQILLEYKHDNVIGLVGYCDEKEEKVIVYEYASRRSLDMYLNDGSLTWIKRLSICIDVASAIDFLHGGVGRDEKVIHRDIKSANILLSDDWKAKLGGFGLSLISPLNQESNYANDHVCGTPGYLDPMYKKSSFLTKESDIYSFGVVLFEILCGRSTLTIHKQEGHYLSDFIRHKFEEGKQNEVVFEQIKEQIAPKSLIAFKTIAYQCLYHEREKRPTTTKVLMYLKMALEFQVERIQQPHTDQVTNKLEKLQLTSDSPENKLQHLKVRLSDIKLATKNFSGTYKIVSRNAYTLYRAEFNHFDKENYSLVDKKNKGEHPKGHNTVVIKRYSSLHNLHSKEEFFAEIEALNSVKHHNIVSLFGFCFEESEMILVTENVSNGFLSNYLGNRSDILNNYLGNKNDTRILTWETRLKICIDVAHALKYIHSEMEDQKMMIHGFISSYSIGLDENWGAKIVDFWYSILLSPNQDDLVYAQHARGRPGYIDPEYEETCILTRASDVYSFGVVLLEVLCGRTAIDLVYLKESYQGLAPIAIQSFCNGTIEEMIDPVLKEEISENNFVLNRGPHKESLRAFIEIAQNCVAQTQKQRPTMNVVVKELEKALLFQNNNKNNHKFSLEDINQATRNFHRDNYIGGGGFGKVYKGNLRDGDGFKTIVAKRLDTSFGQGEQEFLSELQILMEYEHENVIGILGYCDEKDEKIIVYEHAPKGSLDRHLGDVSLTWVKRLNICIDVATALAFFHGGFQKRAKVIHRDIKTANILLNHEWKAKLADFGLSLISPLTQESDYVIDHACGTPGYVDPLYYKSGYLTIESDIYSFGVVMFEILCGRSMFAIQKHEGQFIDFIRSNFKEGKNDELVFELIKEQVEPKSLATFQKIAYQCLHHEREERPTTKEVLRQLKKALEFQNMASTMTKFAHIQIPLEDVVKATNNFHDDNIVEHGGFGIAYKGLLSQSGRLTKIVARRFNYKHGEAELEFLTELSVLFDIKHTNLVSIIGFCNEKDEKIIVNKYEANGSLEQYLNSPNLSWTKRLEISLGVASALSYLHCEEERGYAIIHRLINSGTILLHENWEAKLSCFEHSIKQTNKDKIHLCDPIGEMGYMDPAFEITGGVTHKSDIYSFGVVLFEILCGRKAYIQNEDKMYLAPLAKYHYENKTLEDIILPDLWNQMSPESLLGYSKAAYSCLENEPSQRPDIYHIIDELKKALLSQQRHERNGKKWENLKIPLTDIHQATNNFSETYKITSWNGSALYRANLDHSDKENPSPIEMKNKGEYPNGHNTVIIKRYPSKKDMYKEEMLFVEIEMLSSVKHRNIVTPIGFCVEGSEVILVTENVSNGYLSYLMDHTSNRMHVLNWEKRLKICIDVARALNYLHSEMENEKVMIHRCISSHIIGLDENWGAKIVDFWFSVCLPPNHEDGALFPDKLGRWLYMDPQYKMTGKLKRESDVYSFGIVLFEILCGRLAYDPIYKEESREGLVYVAKRCYHTGTLEEIIDPIIMEETGDNFSPNRVPNKDSLHTFIEIAHQCMATTQDQRPTMKVVVKELEKALFFQEKNKDNPRIPIEDIKLATQTFHGKNKNDHKISLEDIKLATKNFHDDNCIGGKGSVKFYKGNLQDGDVVNTIVAKRLNTRFGQGGKQFLSELQILLEYKQENIIGLLGYCDEQDEKIIVYEYASRRNLDKYLNDASLTWMKRLNICIDVASALYFLHEGIGKQSKVIHGDIKTTNILLNHDWKAKVAGFGHSLISPIAQETEHVIDFARGTQGYVDPLYRKTGLLTIESDIYSFGVVLFEILCGRSTLEIQEHEGHYLPDFIKNKFEQEEHIEVVFKQFKEQIMHESLTIFQKIAYQCLHHEREKRPTIREVLTQLKEALELQVISSLSPNQGFQMRTRPVGPTGQIVNRSLYRFST